LLSPQLFIDHRFAKYYVLLKQNLHENMDKTTHLLLAGWSEDPSIRQKTRAKRHRWLIVLPSVTISIPLSAVIQ